ncbi:hypothetical protein ACWGRV_19620 [Streptomyces sp. NPDC055663]
MPDGRSDELAGSLLEALNAAIGLYHSCGFQEVAAFSDEPDAHHWLEKRITPPPE